LRFFVLVAVAVALMLVGAVTLTGGGAVSIGGAVLLAALLCLAVYDLVQRKHSVLRNYPVAGHLRFLLEAIPPELQQYFIERNYDGRPYDRDTRTVIYERAKGIHGEQAFGTERDLAEPGYEWLLHSNATLDPPDDPPRVRIGGPDCSQPYEMALLNVSAMSIGALSANAIRALNGGARLGGFAHDTGDRQRLLRRTHEGRPLRPGDVRRQGSSRAGQVRLAEALPRRKARDRRRPSRIEGLGGDRRGARGPQG
jgi:glutamate synthase domain-containing protein 2